MPDLSGLACKCFSSVWKGGRKAAFCYYMHMENNKIVYFKTWGFWGLVLLVLSYGFGYFVGTGAVNELFVSVTFFAGLLFSVIGLWKDGQSRSLAIVAVAIAVVVWLFSYLGLKLFY